VRRSIATTAQLASRQIRDLMQSVLVAELLAPSPRIWLVSAWITDAPVVDNNGADFASFVPSWPERELLLSEVLAEYLAAGTQLVVVTNDARENRVFLDALELAAAAVDARRQLHVVSHGGLVTDQERGLHRKRFVTDRAVIWGSMNFTFSGLQRNAEDVALETDPAIVASAINEMEQLYPVEAS
jgi:phosphatidylserine/phosphatidylglycerophosphate/cardiolipin synthase-like enzyme